MSWLLLGRLPSEGYRALPVPDVFTPLAWLVGIGEGAATGLVLTLLPACLVLGVTGGPWLVRAVGGLAGRGGRISSLAGRRLLADVRTPGRVAGVLFIVGGVLAYVANAMVETRLLATMEIEFTVGPAFVTALAVAAGAVLATAVVCGSLVIGATEQVLDGRRGIAALVALAASPELVVRVVRRQLVLSAGPPAALGALVVSLSPFVQVGPGSSLPVLLVLRLFGVLLIGALTSTAALPAARAVRPAVHQAAHPGSLRAA